MSIRTVSLLLLLAAVACKEPSDTPSSAPRETPKSVAPVSPQGVANPMGGAPGTAEAGKSPLAYKAPAGWTEIAPVQFRDLNFKIDAVPEAEAYVTLLPGAGGGTAMNLNRWRGQFGLPELTAEQTAALPKLEAMGQSAILLDQTGKFGGMGGDVKENWRLVGAIIDLPSALITVKMTGPSAALEGELQHFKDFVGSLALAAPGAAQTSSAAMPGASPALPSGHPPIDAAAAALPGAAKPADVNFVWTLPADWTQAGEKPMRLASFQVKDNPQIDVSLIMLGGMAGGKTADVAYWYAQVGKPAPTDEEVAKLPIMKILGQDCPIVEATGPYSGVSGESIANAELLGAICSLSDQTLFIKMTGPVDAVKAQHDAFIAFCLSLKNK